ncbi:MAG: hypothetical protein FWF18_04245 [Dehalococcoidia bacterium]|nr:hypothetical protein [Dehalococcoidia bacterium]
MNNKKLLVLLAMVLVMLPAAACGRTTTPGDTAVPGDPVPHAVDVRFENCLACHAAGLLAATTPFDHFALGYTNKDCSSLPACHSVGSANPPGTVTPPPPPPDPDGEYPVLGGTAGKLPAGHAGYFAAQMCYACHMPGTGADQYPMAPVWAGSVANPGPWTVTEGSPGDHTGRTSDATCITCHTMP